jgi:hypothetical protein
MMRKIKFLLLSIFLTLGLLDSCLEGTLKISGYFENRLFVIENPAAAWAWDKLGEKLRLGDFNRLRLQHKAAPSEKVTVNLAVDFYTFHGTMMAMAPPSTETSTSGGNERTRINLDRAYVDLHFKKFDMSIGKQRVALGVSYLWTPLDIFNRVNLLEPKEEKPGKNAFKLYIPLGASSGLTGVFSPDFKIGTSTSAFRAQTQVWKVDAALTLIRSGTDDMSIYGVDLRGENFIGWWLEAAYLVDHDPLNPTGHRKNTKLVLGYDYTFPLGRGLYWMGEFFFDTTGQKDPHHYNYKLIESGERFTLGRHYLFSLLRYPFNDFTTATLNYIINWKDGSFILNPMLQYEISQDILISSGLYLPLGPKGGEFKQWMDNTFYLWLKINF